MKCTLVPNSLLLALATLLAMSTDQAAGQIAAPPTTYSPSYPPSQEAFRPADPKLRELLEEDQRLEVSASQLVQRYRQADEAEQEGIKQDLREATQQHFDVLGQRWQYEIDQLEARLERLRQMHDRRQQLKPEIVDRRLRELLGEPDPLQFRPSGLNLPGQTFPGPMLLPGQPQPPWQAPAPPVFVPGQAQKPIAPHPGQAF